MTQEEKQLLLKDLCARLPYGVKVNYADKTYDVLGHYGNNLIIVLPFMSNLESHSIETCKPYLRPMSSMTEEERLELSRLTNDKFKFYLYMTKPEIICYEKYNYLEGLKVLDWLNAHYIDYRGLIEKGLALEAPNGMYNI